jgi:hypothetical protein
MSFKEFIKPIHKVYQKKNRLTQKKFVRRLLIFSSTDSKIEIDLPEESSKYDNWIGGKDHGYLKLFEGETFCDNGFINFLKPHIHGNWKEVQHHFRSVGHFPYVKCNTNNPDEFYHSLAQQFRVILGLRQSNPFTEEIASQRLRQDERKVIPYYTLSDLIKIEDENSFLIWIAWNDLTAERILSKQHGDIVPKNLDKDKKYVYFVRSDIDENVKRDFLRYCEKKCKKIENLTIVKVPPKVFDIPLHGLTIYDPDRVNKTGKSGYIGHKFFGMDDIEGFQLPNEVVNENVEKLDKIYEEWEKNLTASASIGGRDFFNHKIDSIPDLIKATTKPRRFDMDDIDCNPLKAFLDSVFQDNTKCSYLINKGKSKHSFQSLFKRENYYVYYLPPSEQHDERNVCSGYLSFRKTEDDLCFVSLVLNAHTKTDGPVEYHGFALLSEANTRQGACWCFLKRMKDEADFLVMAFRLGIEDVESDNIKKSLDVRLALTLGVTSSKGCPNVMRYLLSKHPLHNNVNPTKKMEYISSILNLCSKEIYISEKHFTKIKTDYGLTKEMQDELERLRPKEGETYYSLKATSIEEPCLYDLLRLIRKYDISDPYNKVSVKADNIAYNMIALLTKDDSTIKEDTETIK